MAKNIRRTGQAAAGWEAGARTRGGKGVPRASKGGEHFEVSGEEIP